MNSFLNKIISFALIFSVSFGMMMLFPHRAFAAYETLYLDDSVGAACGVGDREELIETTSGSEVTKALDTTGDSWNIQFGSETTIASGNWQVCIDNTHSNSGGNRQFTILLRHVNSSCTEQAIIVNEATNPSKGATEEICSTLTDPGAITFAANDILLLELTSNSNGHNTVHYGDSGASTGDSRVTTPGEQTATAPSVSTNAASGVTVNSAVLNGTISNDGGEAASTVGFAYGTDSTLATTIATTSESGSFATSATFNELIETLQEGVTYYFRAYGTNSNGTGYGDILNFTTGTDATPTRKMRLFEGYTIKLIGNRIVLYGN